MQLTTSSSELIKVKIELLQRLGESLSSFSDSEFKDCHIQIAKQVILSKMTDSLELEP